MAPSGNGRNGTALRSVLCLLEADSTQPHRPPIRPAQAHHQTHTPPPRLPAGHPGRGPYRQRPQPNSRRSYRRHPRPPPEPHQPRPRLTQPRRAPHGGLCRPLTRPAQAAARPRSQPDTPTRASNNRSAITHQPGIQARTETRGTRNHQHHRRIHCPRHRHLPHGADAHRQRTTRTQRPRTRPALHQCRNKTHHHAVTTRTGRPRTRQRGRAHRHRPRTRTTQLQIDPALTRKHHIEPHTLRQRPIPHRLTGHHPGHILRRRSRELHQHPRRLPLHRRNTAHNSHPFPDQAAPTAHPHARTTSLQTPTHTRHPRRITSTPHPAAGPTPPQSIRATATQSLPGLRSSRTITTQPHYAEVPTRRRTPRPPPAHPRPRAPLARWRGHQGAGVSLRPARRDDRTPETGAPGRTSSLRCGRSTWHTGPWRALPAPGRPKEHTDTAPSYAFARTTEPPRGLPAAHGGSARRTPAPRRRGRRSQRHAKKKRNPHNQKEQ